jgi:hypothetical protein
MKYEMNASDELGMLLYSLSASQLSLPNTPSPLQPFDAATEIGEL